MTNSEIKDKIESEFGWLSPDEKYKMYILVISVYNSAVVDIAAIAKVRLYSNSQMIGETDTYSHYNLNDDNIQCTVNKDAINALKLKL